MKTWFFNLKLIVKIGILSGFLMMFMFGLAGIAIYLTQQIGIEIEEIAEGDLPMISILTEVEVTQLEQALVFERAIRQSEKAFTEFDGEAYDAAVKEFEHLAIEFVELGDQIVTEYKSAEIIIANAIGHASSAHTLSAFKEFDASLKVYEGLHDEYEEQVESIIRMIRQGRLEEGLAHYEAVEELQNRVDHQIKELVKHVEEQTQASARSAEEHEKAMLAAIIFTLIAATIMGLCTTWLFGKGMSNSLTAMTTAMAELADGHLEIDIPSQGRTDEIGAMATTVQVFKTHAQEVARLNAEEEQRTKETRERTEALEELVTSMGVAIESASMGDFSARIKLQRSNDQFSKIANQINDLFNTINRGLSETGAVLGALAQTDLSRRVEGTYHGAFLKLKEDTNSVASKLVGVITHLQDTSATLKTATGEILEGTNDLSQRTLKQAAAIEETSAAMEQLSTTVIQSAKHAEDANVKSQALAETAVATGMEVNKATQAMDRISSSSAKISNVIGMIDDIAFQTNLLALNASVEAARAGEAGKGFAVVAIEVRRLAQSAAEASSEVKQLIEQSTTEVDIGTNYVTVAAEKLQEMTKSIEENSDLMQGLSEASTSQASSIEQVNDAVREMGEMTQHNAALVEETNAAIGQTDGQVKELDGIIEVFKLHAAPGDNLKWQKELSEPDRAHDQRSGDEQSGREPLVRSA